MGFGLKKKLRSAGALAMAAAIALSVGAGVGLRAFIDNGYGITAEAASTGICANAEKGFSFSLNNGVLTLSPIAGKTFAITNSGFDADNQLAVKLNDDKGTVRSVIISGSPDELNFLYLIQMYLTSLQSSLQLLHRMRTGTVRQV